MVTIIMVLSGCNSVGRVSASQAGCRGFEPLHPLHKARQLSLDDLLKRWILRCFLVLITVFSVSIIMPVSKAQAENYVNPQVAAGEWHTVGLKDNGTVVAVGRSNYDQCDVAGWMDILVKK